MASKLDFGPMNAAHLFSEMYPVAASQIFNFLGGWLVYANSSGHMTLALTATAKLFGYGIAPKSATFGSTANTAGYWTSSATAGADKILVFPFCFNPGMVFVMPTTASGGLCVQARVGECCDIVGVNDGTVQYATPGTISTKVLLFGGLLPNADTNAARFAINPAMIQADES